MGFGDFAATSQFYLYGRRHFTRTGYEKHSAQYEQPDLLKGDLDLAGRVCIVTGANSGVGKEVSRFLASKGATLYMVCRSRERAEAARREITEAGGAERVHLLLGDCGLEADIRRIWEEFCRHRVETEGSLRLDCLVCNAGALQNTKTLTAEGIEVTFASHLLFGTYLLGTLALTTMKSTPGSRLVVVSSGGMYNTRFPSWGKATSTDESVAYDGQYAYAYAKRGQVLLCERWAAACPEVAVVSCHPGWSDTPAVEEAYGSQKKYLEPMRSTWQGAEGIVWLCVAPAEKIQSGAFYLDRLPQVKHLAGPFFTEGSATKNSEQEVDSMMYLLDEWSCGRRTPDPGPRPKLPPLQASQTPIELSRFMGRWYVVANIPTFLEKGTINNTEDYSWDEARKVVQVSFGYQKAGSSAVKVLEQRASVINEASTEWRISPKVGGFYLPLGLAYLIVYCSEDYGTTIIGMPDRRYLWIMSRTPALEEGVFKELVHKAEAAGYRASNIIRVPQEMSSAPEALVGG